MKDELFYDEFCGRYFHATKDLIVKKFNELNERIEDDGVVTLAELYNEFGIPLSPPKYAPNGELIDPREWGWSNGKGFHRLTVKELNPNGCPCCGRPW